MSETTLHLEEANELAAAWLQNRAATLGVRVLLIKGATLAHHRLREPRVSADVDLLVEPTAFRAFCEATVGSGWRERPGNFLSERTTLHSRTLVNDRWPTELDLHSFFPGFLADPAIVFEALWRRHERLELAHRECTIPDRLGSILISGLHSLRSVPNGERQIREFDTLAQIDLTESERASLGELALETGSAATLESLLARLGVTIVPSAWELRSPGLRQWRERVVAGANPAYYWMVTLRDARWSRKADVIWRALWPGRAELLVERPETIDTVVGRLSARVARAGRGVRALCQTGCVLARDAARGKP